MVTPNRFEYEEQNPAPWWYRLAARFFPDRCREIPEARNPERVVLRQFALVKRHVYLQQFASSEDPRYMHSHQWRRTIAIGLWGSYREVRIAGPERIRRAPYIYTMDASVVHHAQKPAPGHTSLFIGIGRDDDMKHYYATPISPPALRPWQRYSPPATIRLSWDRHILVRVKRI